MLIDCAARAWTTLRRREFLLTGSVDVYEGEEDKFRESIEAFEKDKKGEEKRGSAAGSPPFGPPRTWFHSFPSFLFIFFFQRIDFLFKIFCRHGACYKDARTKHLPILLLRRMKYRWQLAAAGWFKTSLNGEFNLDGQTLLIWYA